MLKLLAERHSLTQYGKPNLPQTGVGLSEQVGEGATIIYPSLFLEAFNTESGIFRTMLAIPFGDTMCQKMNKIDNRFSTSSAVRVAGLIF